MAAQALSVWQTMAAALRNLRWRTPFYAMPPVKFLPRKTWPVWSVWGSGGRRLPASRRCPRWKWSPGRRGSWRGYVCWRRVERSGNWKRSARRRGRPWSFETFFSIRSPEKSFWSSQERRALMWRTWWSIWPCRIRRSPLSLSWTGRQDFTRRETVICGRSSTAYTEKRLPANSRTFGVSGMAWRWQGFWEGLSSTGQTVLMRFSISTADISGALWSAKLWRRVIGNIWCSTSFLSVSCIFRWTRRRST